MSDSAPLNGLMEELYRIGGGRKAPRTFRQFLLAANADQAEAVLRNPNVFHKQYGGLSTLFTARQNTDGEEWRARRSLTQDHFNAAAKPANRGRVVEIFEAALDDVDRQAASPSLPLREPVLHAVMAATTRIFFDALGADHDTADLAASFESLRRLVHVLQHSSFFPSRMLDATTLTSQIEAVHADLRRYATEEPLVGRLIERLGLDYGTGTFDPASELLGNFLAGSESSSTVLAWAMLMIGGFPELQERLRREAQAEGERAATDVFLSEVLRLFPPLPAVTRLAVEDFDAPAFSARKGENVLLSVIGVHLDPEHWTDPTRFDPQRAEFAARTFNRRAFIPFLHGARVCGGASLAWMELTEGFSALLRRFRFRRTGEAMAFQYVVALRPVLDDVLTIERL